MTSKILEEKLREFEEIMNRLSPYEGEFVITVKPDEGFSIGMSRDFLLSKFEGVSYSFYGLIFKKVWARTNLTFIEAGLEESDIVDEMPQAWNALYETIPGKGGYVEVFFPNKGVMEG